MSRDISFTNEKKNKLGATILSRICLRELILRSYAQHQKAGTGGKKSSSKQFIQLKHDVTVSFRELLNTFAISIHTF